MPDKLELFGIKTPLIEPGDDMGGVLISSIRESGMTIMDDDIVVLAESAVATAEGRLFDLNDVEVGKKASELGLKYAVDPREMELILGECDEIIGGVPGAVLTITKGNLSPNAGIDGSNAPPDCVVLLPEDPASSADRIRKQLEAAFGCRLGVIVGDSRTQPMRLGCVGIALGCSGLRPVEDADNLVSAAQLIMGEAGEGIPAVVVRGLDGIAVGNCEIPIFSKDECMYYSNISH